MILSASGSSSMPIVVIWPRLRARYPSSPSVIDASTKRIDARISCVPLDPAQGKCGDRIQRNNGIMMIRVMVMELGRFTVRPLESERCCQSYRYRQTLLEIAAVAVGITPTAPAYHNYKR